MTRSLKELLSWAQKNERRLGAAFFALGFLTDIFTFGFLPVSVVNYFFLAYLGIAVLCTFGSHAFAYTQQEFKSTKMPWWKKTLSVVFPLGLQYAFGGLLSGFFMFYTAHSVIQASWPFLLLLLLVYGGNEYFRMHKTHLVFQTAIFFFSLYAYTIFALPLYLGSIGPWIFALSTVTALLLFALLLSALYRMNRKRVSGYLKRIIYSVAGITIAISLSYATGLVPPIPLALVEGNIYHRITKLDEGYAVQKEEDRPWWYLGPTTVHISPQEPLYAFSAIGAPIKFSSTVVHRWERKTERGWITESKIAFPIAGGREGGYRGYSEKTNVVPGQWRVSVETPSGQVIGRIRFAVEEPEVPPLLIEEVL